MYADALGHLDVANLLIEKGADVNVRDKNGRTALIWDAKNWFTEIVHFFKEKYAKEEAIEKKEEESEEEDFRYEEYDEAIEIVKREREISISKLQRRMRIRFNRAARIIEEMEKDGIIVKDPNSGKYIYKEEKRRRK
jgi:DNA segregation ATPase FtsK/SpoIIIE-like protein